RKRHRPPDSLPQRQLARFIEHTPPEQQRRHDDVRWTQFEEEQPGRDRARGGDQDHAGPDGQRAEAHARNRPWRNALSTMSSNGRSTSAPTYPMSSRPQKFASCSACAAHAVAYAAASRGVTSISRSSPVSASTKRTSP